MARAISVSESPAQRSATPAPAGEQPRVAIAAPPASVISLRGGGVQFGPRWVWRHIDFDVAEGEFVVVLGPNGAGKTTLLRVLLGLLHLDEGAVDVLSGDARHARRLVGYVPQRRTLDRDLNVRARDLVSLGVDGVRWGISLSTRARRAQREMVEDALDAVGARAYADRPVGLLSGGEQQRLLLAQALVTRPRILLLDEPLASLDLRSQAVISSLVGSIARARGIAVVLVAHDVNPLVSVLDRVAYVASGSISSGRPEEIITSESLSRLYDYPVEVLRDSRGRIVVVGLEDRDAHHG
jgi:zinc/manganese transport system ATP-binding protein